MPRTTRAAVGGYCYHVIHWGNRRAEVFHHEGDYHAFVRLLRQACARVQLRVLAYCLMPNHFHLVAWPVADDHLARWMDWLLTTHVRRYHRQYGTCGHVWQGRFRAFPIEQDMHLLTVLRYVERNGMSSATACAPTWQRGRRTGLGPVWPSGSIRRRCRGWTPDRWGAGRIGSRGSTNRIRRRSWFVCARASSGALPRAAPPGPRPQQQRWGCSLPYVRAGGRPARGEALGQWNPAFSAKDMGMSPIPPIPRFKSPFAISEGRPLMPTARATLSRVLLMSPA